MFKTILKIGGIGIALIFVILVTASSLSKDTITSQSIVAEEKVLVATSTGTSAEVEPVAESSKSSADLYSVIKVIDGDTLSVSINGKVEIIRLIGIDTPETVDPRKAVQCFGTEASNKAKELLTGKKVKIEKDDTQGERDKYGRLLAYIYIENGMFYNKYMIEQGYAYEYTYNLPYKYQSEFKAAQKTAENQKRGLWASGVCEEKSNSSVTQAPSNTTPTQPTQTQPANTQAAPSSTGDKDCKDFQTQAEAQAYFDSKGGNPSNNVDRLDGSDKDGRVCESLR